MNSHHTIMTTALGDVTVVVTDDAISGLYFPHHWYMPAQSELGERVDVDSNPLLVEAEGQLQAYLSGARRSFELPTSRQGASFSQRVWDIIDRIPFGETTTYGTIALELGDKNLAQAVGRAVGHNPLCIIVPCHRVVSKDGKLTGYAGGLTRKKFLLELEEPTQVKAGKLF